MNAELVAVGILQAVVYLLFVRMIDLYEREPLRYVVPVFIWGFTVAVIVALIFNTLAQITISTVASTNVTNFITAVFVAPVVEESSKGLALLLVFLVAFLMKYRTGSMEFSGVMDGIVYGSAVGFGFSIAEDILYYAQFGSEAFVMRRIFGGFAHASFTSLTGAGIGLIPWVRSNVLKVLLPCLGLGCAMLLHATFNFTASVFGPVAYVVLFFVVLAYIILIAVWLHVERRAIRDELREEVSLGTISAQEYSILPTYFRRSAYYLGLLFSGRLGAWRRAREVHGISVDLAFTKRLARHRHGGPSPEQVDVLRRRIRAARGVPAPLRA